MSFQFNEIGKEYISVGFDSDRGDYGVLPIGPATLLDLLHTRIGTQWHNTNEKDRSRLRKMSGCLDRLSAFFIQVSRVAIQAKLLREQAYSIASNDPDPNSPTMAALLGRELYIDFESLLFHGRAALDRLFKFICEESNFDPSKKKGFRHNIESLKKQPLIDEKVNYFCQLIDIASDIKGALIDLEDLVFEEYKKPKEPKALRSQIAHYRSLLEGTELAFMVYIHNKRFIIFDSETRGYPVVTTAWHLTDDIPFVIINTIAAYIGESARCSLIEFKPSWHNPTVAHNSYIDTTGIGIPVTIVQRMTPVGYEISDTVCLKPDFFDLAESL